MRRDGKYYQRADENDYCDGPQKSSVHDGLRSVVPFKTPDSNRYFIPPAGLKQKIKIE
jgi:hypothetical protein